MPAADAEPHRGAARCASECWAPVLQGRRHLKKSDVQSVVSRFRSLRRRAGRRVVETELSREELAEVLELDEAGADVGPIFEALVGRGGPGASVEGGAWASFCDLRLLLVVLAGLTKAKAVDRMRFAAMLLDERGRGYLLEDQLALILRANALHSSSAQDDFGARARVLISRVEATRGAALPDAEAGSGITHDELVEAVRRFPGDVFPADGHQPVDLDGSQTLTARQLQAPEGQPEPSEPPEQLGPLEPSEPLEQLGQPEPSEPLQQLGPPEPSEPLQQLGPPEPPERPHQLEPPEEQPELMQPSQPPERPDPPGPEQPQQLQPPEEGQPEQRPEPAPQEPGAGAPESGAAVSAPPREPAEAAPRSAEDAEGARPGAGPPGPLPAEEPPAGAAPARRQPDAEDARDELADAAPAAQGPTGLATADGGGGGLGPPAAAAGAPAGGALREAGLAAEEAFGTTGHRDDGGALRAAAGAPEGPPAAGGLDASREDLGPTGQPEGAAASGLDAPAAAAAAPERPRPATGPLLGQRAGGSGPAASLERARPATGGPAGGPPEAATPRLSTAERARLLTARAARVITEGQPGSGGPKPAASAAGPERQDLRRAPLSQRGDGAPPPAAWEAQPPPPPSARSAASAVQPPSTPPPRPPTGPATPRTPPSGATPRASQGILGSRRGPLRAPAPDFRRLPLTPRQLELGPERLPPPPPPPAGAQSAPEPPPLSERSRSLTPRSSPLARIGIPEAPPPRPPGEADAAAPTRQAASVPPWISPPRPPIPALPGQVPSQPGLLELGRAAGPSAGRGSGVDPALLRLDLSRVAAGREPLPEALRRGASPGGSTSSGASSASSLSSCHTPPLQPSPAPRGPKGSELDDALARLELGPEPPAEEPAGLQPVELGSQDGRLADQLVDEPETTQWTFGRYLKHQQRQKLLEICGSSSRSMKTSSRGCVFVLGCILVNLGLLFFAFRAHAPDARARAGEGEIVISEDALPAFGGILILGGCAALCHCACFSGGGEPRAHEQEDDAFPSDLVDEEAGQQALDLWSEGSAGASYHQAMAQPKRNYRQLTLLLKEELKRAPAVPQRPAEPPPAPSPRDDGAVVPFGESPARGKVVAGHKAVLEGWPGLDRHSSSLKKPGRRVRIVAEPRDGGAPEGSPLRRAAARGRAPRGA